MAIPFLYQALSLTPHPAFLQALASNSDPAPKETADLNLKGESTSKIWQGIGTGWRSYKYTTSNGMRPYQLRVVLNSVGVVLSPHLNRGLRLSAHIDPKLGQVSFSPLYRRSEGVLALRLSRHPWHYPKKVQRDSGCLYGLVYVLIKMAVLRPSQHEVPGSLQHRAYQVL